MTAAHETGKFGSASSSYTILSDQACKLLGLHGRMMYRSKTLGGPTTIFNATLFDSNARRIWFGDLEIERDYQKLIKLSETEGTLYILRESDGYLDFMPSIEYVQDAALVTVKNGSVTYDPHYERYIELRRAYARRQQESVSGKKERKKV